MLFLEVFILRMFLNFMLIVSSFMCYLLVDKMLKNLPNSFGDYIRTHKTVNTFISTGITLLIFVAIIMLYKHFV